MAVYLNEEAIESIIKMDEAVDFVEQSFRFQGEGLAVNKDRQRLRSPKHTMQVMAATAAPMEVAGLKIYSGSSNHVLLYSTKDGSLLSVMDARKLSQVRTGAASGVATKYLAPESASTVGILGTGHQAEGQLEAICAVRNVQQVRAYSRSAERRNTFADAMSRQLGVEVVPVEQPQQAVEGADILVTITNSSQPVLLGEWLHPGVHINAAGGNSLLRQELDVEAVRRADLIYTDSLSQSKLESADLFQAAERGAITWEQVEELGKVVSGRSPGRTSLQQITLFESHGIALWDIAVASLLYSRAIEMQVGVELPF